MSGDLENLQRCLSCKHSRDRNPENGTLICQHYDMLIDNQADEIPDDCVAFEPEHLDSSPSSLPAQPSSETGKKI